MEKYGRPRCTNKQLDSDREKEEGREIFLQKRTSIKSTQTGRKIERDPVKRDEKVSEISPSHSSSPQGS